MTAADDYNAKQITSGILTMEHITALVRHWQASTAGLEVDGEAGPKTVESINKRLVPGKPATRPAPFLSCPLPTLADGRRAVVTSSFRPADRPNHDGCDWFYEWKPGDKPDFVGDRGAAGYTKDHLPRWVVPTGTLAVAACAGVVQMAGDSATGHRVWVDHRNGWRTGYFHLLDLRVKTGDSIAAGAPLGLVGDNPADDDGRHLHFELSPVDRYEPTDPEPCLLR